MAARMAPMLGMPAEDVLTMLEATAIYDVPANAVELFPGGEYHDTTLAAVAAHAREAGWNRGSVTAAELIETAPVPRLVSVRTRFPVLTA